MGIRLVRISIERCGQLCGTTIGVAAMNMTFEVRGKGGGAGRSDPAADVDIWQLMRQLVGSRC